MIGVTSEALLQGKTSPYSTLQWKSSRVRRVCNSSLAAETLCLVAALNQLEWSRCMWHELTNGAFTLKNWEKDIASKPAVVAVDAKSIYDHVSKPTVSVTGDKRSAIDLSYIREILERDGSRLHWVDARFQAADDLTKLSNGGLIRGYCKDASAILVSEKEALQRREKERHNRQAAAMYKLLQQALAKDQKREQKSFIAMLSEYLR